MLLHTFMTGAWPALVHHEDHEHWKRHEHLGAFYAAAMQRQDTLPPQDPTQALTVLAGLGWMALTPGCPSRTACG